MKELCEHFKPVGQVAPTTRGCAGCLAIGADWTQLRMCLTCGYVGCCEDSKHAHALAHFNATGHPLIASIERGETWGWCYVHNRYYDPLPAGMVKRPAVIAGLFGRTRRRA